AAMGLVILCWPRMAPTISTGDMPPICSQIYFQVQPFSRLMSSSFSVRSERFMRCLPGVALVDKMRGQWLARWAMWTRPPGAQAPGAAGGRLGPRAWTVAVERGEPPPPPARPCSADAGGARLARAARLAVCERRARHIGEGRLRRAGADQRHVARIMRAPVEALR